MIYYSCESQVMQILCFYKTEFFGKNGQITLQFKTLGTLNPEKRKDFASHLNKLKEDLTSQIEQKVPFPVKIFAYQR